MSCAAAGAQGRRSVGQASRTQQAPDGAGRSGRGRLTAGTIEARGSTVAVRDCRISNDTLSSQVLRYERGGALAGSEGKLFRIPGIVAAVHGLLGRDRASSRRAGDGCAAIVFAPDPSCLQVAGPANRLIRPPGRIDRARRMDVP